jgi:hypothetical protein
LVLLRFGIAFGLIDEILDKEQGCLTLPGILELEWEFDNPPIPVRNEEQSAAALAGYAMTLSHEEWGTISLTTRPVTFPTRNPVLLLISLQTTSRKLPSKAFNDFPIPGTLHSYLAFMLVERRIG